jgi:glucose/arabinose dehydrogenase
VHIRVIRGRRKTAVITFLGLLVTSLGISQMVAADSLPNTGVPAGFSINSVAEGFDMPTVAQFAPDGRIFVAQKDGVIKIVKNGQTLAQPFYVTPKVNNYVDRGLLGMTLDPNFASNHYVYLFYTYDNQPGVNAAPKTGRLIRVTASGDTAIAGSEQVILGTTVGTSAKPSCENYAVTTDCIPADGLSHGPDTVLFGPDGKLYVSIGDSASYDNVDMKAFRAQNLDSLSGKILRINPDGTAPADNPFYTGNPSDNKSKVYAYGLRNPFRFSIRDDGVIVVGDVGWSLWEEVNVVFPGANFGWPCYEGNEQQNGTGGGTGTYKDLAACQQMYAAPPDALSLPKLTYPHPPGSAIVGGTFYDGTNYPAEYQGRYFYGDYAKNQVYALQLDGNDDLVPGSNMTFANNAGGPVSFFKGPDGDLYYVGIITGAIYHLAYSTGNQAPTAFAAANKTYGPAPLTVDFTSAGSFDPEGDPLTYAWNFGDGTTSNEVNPTHTYTANGTYTATLTVEDTAGNASTKTVLIYPGASAPTVTITSPTNMSAANAGDTINLAGSATDTKDGAMPGNKLHWNVVIQHCPLDSCHAHTVTSFDGATGSFAFPAHDGPFYIQIALSTTNSIGLTTTKTINVYPVGQKITSALQFDGINDYAKSANPADFKLQQFTVEAMVKTFSTGANGSEVISQGDNWSMRVLPSGGIAFAYANGSFWEYFAAESAQVKDGLWHHIAATKTSTGVKLYVDGAPVLNEADMLPIEYKYGADLVVGAHGTYDDQFYFNGAIDELRVWTTPRTDAQIAQYRSQTLPTGTTGLTAYYKADEGTGTTAKDSSVAGTHTLSFVNGANWTAGAPLSDPPTTPGVNTIKDTFTGTTLDAAKWTKFGTASRTVQNGDLTISPATSGTGWHGITSKATYELKNNAVFVEVPKTTNGNVPAETQLVLEKDANNRVLVIRSIYGMVFRSVVNGAFTDTGVAYNATNMRWWRIRETTGKVYFETSADATTWTVRRTINDPFDLSKVKVLLDAGTYQSTSNPGTAKFDNLNTLPAAQAGASALQLTMPQ